MPELPGFQRHFGFSNSDADQLRYFVSIVYLGAGVGALLSFFINDRIGRLWSWRLYITIWIIGQLVATSAPGLTGLYAARIVSGLGIGSLTVTGTMSIVEIAPAEIRGLLAVWFSVAMCLASVCAVFCVYGVYIHVGTSRLQYQTIWFSPCIFFFFLIIASFFLSESPRWLWLVGRHDDAIKTLVKLRGLPADHPRVRYELDEIREAIRKETEDFGGSRSHLLGILKETFTVPANLRRVQQTLISYALAQLSGANSITSYFVPVLKLLGKAGGNTHSLFLTGMYSMSKLFVRMPLPDRPYHYKDESFWISSPFQRPSLFDHLQFTLIASFFFVDALGRRGSLFVGAGLQMVSDIYIAVYLKYKQAGTASDASSEAALALIFIHALGYALGEHPLSYRRITRLLTDVCFSHRTFRSTLCLRRGALAQPTAIFRRCTVSMFSLAFLLRHEFRGSFATFLDQQLGGIPLFRWLVLPGNLLCVLHGPRNIWSQCRGNRWAFPRALV